MFLRVGCVPIATHHLARALHRQRLFHFFSFRMLLAMASPVLRGYTLACDVKLTRIDSRSASLVIVSSLMSSKQMHACRMTDRPISRTKVLARFRLILPIPNGIICPDRFAALEPYDPVASSILVDAHDT